MLYSTWIFSTQERRRTLIIEWSIDFSACHSEISFCDIYNREITFFESLRFDAQVCDINLLYLYLGIIGKLLWHQYYSDQKIVIANNEQMNRNDILWQLFGSANVLCHCEQSEF